MDSRENHKDSLPTAPQVAVVACDVLRDESLACIAKSQFPVHIELLEQGLHNDPPKLRVQIQAAIDRIEEQLPSVATVVLVYGLCSRGTEGVFTKRCRLVLPRAHDCITLLLGDRRVYAEYVARNPGTYWYSPGWNRCHVPPGPERFEKLATEYRKKFDEEDVQYLMETEQAWFKSYHRAAFVDLGTSDAAPDIEFTKRCADWLGWSFDQQHGDPKLLHDLITGPWDDERFLVMNPGESPRMTADDSIVTAVTVRGKELSAVNR